MKSRQQVDGGAWQSSGATVSGLLVGDNNHTVNFNTVFGWVSPTNEAVSISPNSTTTATGTYVPIIIIPGTGSLQVNISPAAAVTAGAKWQVDGGAWQNSGAAVANLAAGNHMVSFNMVSGWTTPANQAVSVSANSTTTASGTYIVSPPPALSGIYIIQTNSTSVVFGIPQALSTNYSVSGYYIANGVTNSFPGTGAGPSIWGIIGLRPITAYTFWFHVNDLVNYVHGADVSTNVTTLPVPTLQGLSVEATNSTSIVFQIPQALSTNYGVGGYYVAGGVTNIFPGTGYGPNIWGVGSLRPGTTYTFYFYEYDLVNKMSGSAVAISATTLPVPPPQGVSVAAITPTNILFQIQPPLATNYSVGGYYVANGVTNSFGTGSGPPRFLIGSLTPNTSYAFYYWAYDLVNGMNSTTLSNNVTTLPVPGYKQIFPQLLSSGNMQLSFVGDAGVKYALDGSSGLSPANWIPLVTNPADANGSLIFTNTLNSSSNYFWRIRSVP